MTLSQLIEILLELQANHEVEDEQVYATHQQSYPFIEKIAGVWIDPEDGAPHLVLEPSSDKRYGKQEAWEDMITSP